MVRGEGRRQAAARVSAHLTQPEASSDAMKPGGCSDTGCIISPTGVRIQTLRLARRSSKLVNRYSYMVARISLGGPFGNGFPAMSDNVGASFCRSLATSAGNHVPVIPGLSGMNHINQSSRRWYG